MKITSSLLLLAALSPATLCVIGCSKTDTPKTLAQDAAAAAKDVAKDAKNVAVDSWDSIKDYSFDKREDFAASLDRMGQTCDRDLAAMNAKLKGMPEATAKTRDAAVREFNSASAALKVQLTALRASSADTWTETKKQTGLAWERVRTAFAELSAPAAT